MYSTSYAAHAIEYSTYLQDQTYVLYIICIHPTRMYVYIYMYVCIYIYVCMYIYIYIHIYVCMYVCIYVCMYVYIFM